MPENRGETFDSGGSETGRSRPVSPPGSIPEQSVVPVASRDAADAVVVGGGVVGCSIAYHLARRGATVVLVERDTLGSQSTGHCAGGVRRQFSSSTNVVMQQLSVQLLAGLEAETGVDPEFRHIGYLFVLTSDRQVEDFRRFLPMCHETGVTDALWLEAHEV